MVWYYEDDETYHLFQKPQTINSLEVALVDAKIVKNTKGEVKLKQENIDNDAEESGDEESNEAINIGDEISIHDDSYELLE